MQSTTRSLDAADLDAAEDHPEGCRCEACGWLDAHYRARGDARAALAEGGLSAYGREVLGW